jgi:hypothetical protein
MYRIRFKHPARVHISAALDIGLLQCELAIRGAMATIGAAEEVVIKKANTAT